MDQYDGAEDPPSDPDDNIGAAGHEWLWILIFLWEYRFCAKINSYDLCIVISVKLLFEHAALPKMDHSKLLIFFHLKN